MKKLLAYFWIVLVCVPYEGDKFLCEKSKPSLEKIVERAAIETDLQLDPKIKRLTPNKSKRVTNTELMLLLQGLNNRLSNLEKAKNK